MISARDTQGTGHVHGVGCSCFSGHVIGAVEFSVAS